MHPSITPVLQAAPTEILISRQTFERLADHERAALGCERQARYVHLKGLGWVEVHPIVVS